MPVIFLDVSNEEWNDVAMPVILFGLDMTPDSPARHGNTVVEITGSNEKLAQVFSKIRRKTRRVVLLGYTNKKEIAQSE